MENKELTLTLNVNEVNVILNLVAKGSYESVVGLINKIQKQASEQLTDKQSE